MTWLEAVVLLDTIPGMNRRTAEKMLAEMGLDTSRFPTAGTWLHGLVWRQVPILELGGSACSYEKRSSGPGHCKSGFVQLAAYAGEAGLRI